MNGTYWILNSSRTVTWATADTYPNFWTSPGQAAVLVNRALGKFQEVANINFQYAGHYSDPNFAPANMVFTGTSFPWLYGKSANVLAWAYFPNEQLSDSMISQWFGSSTIYPNSAGDVWINWASEAIFYPTYPGSDGFFLFLHEIGHAVGLKHPHDSGGTGWPTATQFGLAPADIQLLTVMSYNEGSPVSSWWGGNPGSLMPLDILALQRIYGANTSTRADDSTYTLYDDDVLESFWDAGGQDLVTAINSWSSWTIDLQLVDDAYGHTIGVASPTFSQTTLKFFFDAENAVGSAYGDSIKGNELGNTLVGLQGADVLEGRLGNDIIFGGPGDDAIDGGAGVDIAYFTGSRLANTFTKTITGYRISGPEGTDTLTGIERLEFLDKRVALDLSGGDAAANAVRLIGAAYGPSYITSNSDWVGIGIALFDAGYSMFAIMSSVLQTSPPMTNATFVDIVYTNVVGSRPDLVELTYYTEMLTGSGGGMSRAELLVLAANSPANEAHINLVGLQQTGVEYI